MKSFKNRKAYHDYFIEHKVETGIVLRGTEIKSIRAGNINFKDSHAKIENNECWMYNFHISPWEKATFFNHESERKRKLLLHKSEIKRLRAEYPDKKVYAVISDIGASGAYYIASAADEIYANRASLVGSIGVVAGGFGFTEVMEKLGVERRLYTAGENKAFLDPFSAEEPEEVAFWQNVLENTHAQFITAVQQGRGDRLADDPRLFSGLIWSGEQALELGLIDGLGSSSHVARQIIGHEKLVDYSRARSPLQNLVDQLGIAVGQGVAQHISEQRLQLR